MKVVRILVITAAIVAVLVVIAVALAFTPAVQTWGARRVLAQQPDMRGDVRRVEVGLDNVNVTALTIRRSGMILTVPDAHIELPVSSAVGKRVLIRKLVAKGWILDLTAPLELGAPVVEAEARQRILSQLAVIGLAQVAAAPAPGKAAPAMQSFQGVFSLLNLPIDLQVDASELEGDVIFPTAAGQPPGRAHVTLQGGQLGAGRTGEFKVAGVAKLSGAKAPVNDVTLNGTLQAKMDTPRTFESLAFALDVVATGPQFPQGAKLRADGKAGHSGRNEDYAFTLRSGESGAGKDVVAVHASYPVEARQLDGTWKLDARDADLAPLALGIPMPTFVAVGNGRFQTDNTFKEVHASGRFESTFDKLETVSAPLAVLGHVRVTGDFDLLQNQNGIRVDRFNAVTEGNRPIASIAALQPIELNATTGELKVADPAKDLVRIKLEGVPLAWVQPFVSDISIGGDDVRGEFVARAQDGGFAVRSVSPLTLGRLTVAKAGQPLLQAVDVTVAASGDYSPKLGWQADVSELLLQSGGAAWARVAVKTGQPAGKDQPVKATGQYQLDLPLAFRQPVLAPYSGITQGKAAGDFSGVLTTSLQQIAAKLELRDLAAEGVTQPIPIATINLRADLHADGLMKVQAPIVLQQGDRKSDLDLSAEVRPVGAKQSIDAQVASNLLYVEDLQVLAAPFTMMSKTPAPASNKPSPGAGPTKPTAGPRSPSADTVPFWNGFTGQLRLSLKKVVYSPDVQAADVSGSMKIGADAVSLEDVRAVMGEGSSAKLAGGVTFDPKAKQPYLLKGDLNVTNLNPGPILALLSPQRQPTAEGQFDMVGKFSGEAANADALANKTSAELKLTSRGGKFHGFAASMRAADIGKYQKTTSTAAAVIGSVAGLFGQTEVAKYAERARAAADIFKRFIEIDFDQLNLELSHRPGEATRIKDFSLISPELRLIANGAIDDVANVSWLERPLHLDMQMAVRGEQATDMRLLGLLAEQKDPLGYVPLVEKFPVEGSLSSLGSQALTQLLTRALSEK